MFSLEISKDLSMKGSMKKKLKDYAAYQEKKAIKDAKTIEGYQTKENEANGDLKFENLITSNIDSIQTGLNISADISQVHFVAKSNDVYFFKPVIKSLFTENPFKAEKREYPVEFNYPYNLQQMYTFQIPDNMEIAELPKPSIVQSPDNTVKYTYGISVLGKKISLMVSIQINKSFFVTENYELIKSYFQMVIDKQNELIVLKATE
jgi:hypothetical protein